MNYMFGVRSSPWPAPSLQSSPRPARCVRLGRPPPPASRGSHLAPHATVHATRPPFGSWQQASAFNQPLSFDTSSVTSMYYMFYVRSSPCPGPQSAVEPSPTRCVHRGRPPPSASKPAPHPIPYALLSTLGSTRRRSTSR
eukprot:scaffold81772_cov49-Phaeocystis_antarctica.AAC.7